MTFSGGSDFMTDLAAGEIQGGLVGPGPAMNSYISGVDVQLIAGSSTGGTVIVSRKDSGIEKPEDITDATFISPQDRKSTRLNSSHVAISYAVFCLKKKNTQTRRT